MSKYLELLDTGARIAGRFYSHCPQTARLYYHPPSNSDHGGSDTRQGLLQDSTQISGYGLKVAKGFDTSDLIFFSGL